MANETARQAPRVADGISDVAALRQRARAHLEDGAVIQVTNGGDKLDIGRAALH